MKNKDNRLRKQAEIEARKLTALLPGDLEAMSPEKSRQTLHELLVHRIELEMQNEELRQTQKELDTARARYFDLYDLAPVGYCVISEAGQILETNLTAAKQLGVARGSLVKHSINRFVFKEDLDIYYLHRKQLFETGEPQVCELRMQKADGTVFWAHLEATVAQDAAGTPICRVVLSDISVRKRNEEKLKESEESYKFLFEYSGVAFTYYRTDGTIISFNRKAAENMGGQPDDFTDRSIYELFPREDADFYMGRIVKAVSEENPQEYEDYVPLKSGGKWFFSTFSRMINIEGNVAGVQIISQDITERKQAADQSKRNEDALKRQNSLFSSLLKLLPMGVFMVEAPSGKPLVANETAYHLLGRGILPDATKHNLSEVYRAHKVGSNDPYPPDEMPILLGMQGESSYIDDMVIDRPDGTETHLEIFGTPVVDDLGHIWASLVSFRDITERKRMENALAQEKKLLETTLKTVGDGVISTDNKGSIAFMNKMAEALTGWTQEAACGRAIDDVLKLVHEGTRHKCENLAMSILLEGEKNPEIADDHLLISKDGTVRPVDDSAAPILHENGEMAGVVYVFRDFSDAKQKQEEIEFLSYHDQLTGLYNRRFYEEELRRLDVQRNLPLTIAMGDVNGLKLINDSFGHAVGDELLQKVAGVIRDGCRADDIIARLGGDEFVIILPRTDGENTERIMNRIKELTRKEKAGSIDISISFGYDTKSGKDEDIQKTFKNAEDHMYRHKLSESTSMRSKTIDLIMNTLFEKNNREMRHSIRVSKICEEIAADMGFDQDDIVQIRIAGLMHDIGKIGVDEEILNKPDMLGDREWVEMKKHSEIGYRILSSVNEFSEIADYILEHHERWDGKGYPRGLSGDDISLRARIIAIADAYDAMTTERTYCRALSEKQAINEIRRCSGTQFDPVIVQRFIEKILRRENNI